MTVFLCKRDCGVHSVLHHVLLLSGVPTCQTLHNRAERDNFPFFEVVTAERRVAHVVKSPSWLCCCCSIVKHNYPVLLVKLCD